MNCDLSFEYLASASILKQCAHINDCKSCIFILLCRNDSFSKSFRDMSGSTLKSLKRGQKGNFTGHSQSLPETFNLFQLLFVLLQFITLIRVFLRLFLVQNLEVIAKLVLHVVQQFLFLRLSIQNPYFSSIKFLEGDLLQVFSVLIQKEDQTD